MSATRSETIAVMGATGRQGGAVARHLLRDGWRVRAVTRKPQSANAKTLADAGADVAQGDMGDRPSMDAALRGAYGVYSVQNPMLGGFDAEVHQGRTVADAARAAGVHHLVYGSAGPGTPGTGVPSWESKLLVEAHMRGLGLPVTVLRPMAFMELMTDKGFYPAASTWGVMTRLVGESRPLPWLCVDDLGAIAATAFAARESYVGRDLKLASDVQTIGACRAAYRDVRGKAPSSMPMPVWLFERFVGKDLIAMWRWLRTNEIDLDTAPAKAILPDALSVREWLERGLARGAAARGASPPA